MKIDQAVLRRMLLSAASLLDEKADILSEIDSRFGDGDHGITMRKIARCIREEVSRWTGGSLGHFLEDLGMAIMEVKGGSAGPLYGTLIGGLGSELGETDVLDVEGARMMLRGALTEMRDITDAKVGDKTMMDALIPAVEAAETAGDTVEAVWLAAAEAAEKGAEASKAFISRYGRAKSYKEQTIGTPDAGAVSVSLFIRGMANGMKEGDTF